MRVLAVLSLSVRSGLRSIAERRRPRRRRPIFRIFRPVPSDIPVRGLPGGAPIATPSAAKRDCSTRGRQRSAAQMEGGSAWAAAIRAWRSTRAAFSRWGGSRKAARCWPSISPTADESGRCGSATATPTARRRSTATAFTRLDRDGTLVCLNVAGGQLIWDKSLSTISAAA